MSTQFDTLERQLNTLRAARLPVTTRQGILHEMERPLAGHRSAFWQFAHRAGFQVALAGAASLALMVGWHRLSWSPRPTSGFDEPSMVSVNALLPSLAFLETQLAAVSPIGANTVAVLRSPSTLTNIQIRR
ncbi:MAG: hypothetical protein ABSH14_16025 [Verrucomicrobiia bacterium]|jgi:hypothetical protein